MQLLHRQLGLVHKRIDTLLDALAQPIQPSGDAPAPEACEHRDVEILLSMPGVGRVTVATMLAQAHRAIHDRDYHALRAQSGLAPITKASGKSRRVQMRRACDSRLRNAGHALRALADRLLRIQFAMLRTGTLYDPSRLVRSAAAPAAAA